MQTNIRFLISDLNYLENYEYTILGRNRGIVNLYQILLLLVVNIKIKIAIKKLKRAMVKNKDTPKPRDYRYHSNQI